MQDAFVLILLLLLLWILLAPVLALVRAADAQRRAERAEQQLEGLLPQLQRINRELAALRAKPAASVSPAGPAAEAEAVAQPVPPPEAPAATMTPPAARVAPPPPLPPLRETLPVQDARPQPQPDRTPLPASLSEPAAERKPLDLEQFMGVKLFAWLGGVAMFFGVVFFVIYAFEKNLIPPAMRVALGFLTGAGLLAGGLLLNRRGTHQPLAHALCATAVLVLYGVSFGAYQIYGFFNQAGTFALMALVTVVALLIAVRLNALTVAVLGMVGGYLNPVLVSTGSDELVILTGYLALLAAGLVVVSRHRNWRFLVTAAVVGTVLLQTGWFVGHFRAGSYGEGPQVLWPMAALLLLQGLFATALWLERRRGGSSRHPEIAALVMAGSGWLFAFLLLGNATVAVRVELLYGWVLVQSLLMLALAWLSPRLMPAQAASALLCFVHLAAWTRVYLDEGRLGRALGLYLLFGALHAVVPLTLARRVRAGGGTAKSVALWPWAAVVPLLLAMLWIVQLPEPSLMVWLAALLLNLLVVVLAPRAGSALPALGAMLATLALAVTWLFSVPAAPQSLGSFLGICLGFAALFAVAGRWLGGQLAPTASAVAERTLEQAVTAMLPALAGLLPFGLLLLAIMRIPVPDPTLVFGAGGLMVLLLLGLVLLDRRPVLAPAAWLGMIAVQALWHLAWFRPDAVAVPLGWAMAYYLLFLVFPFVFRRALAERTLPWITAAASQVGYFLLVHDMVKRGCPAMAGMMGLLPGAFALPSLLALLVVLRMMREMNAVERSKLAWFGGVALFFITLVFPIQLDRHWLTVSWAVEGALLLWLFRRVPHPGLQLTGLGLLAVVFVRLVLNPAVIESYPRSPLPVWNWFLYTYGIAAASMLMAARWFSDPQQRLARVNCRAILYGLCGILLFVLLNLEIADYFTPQGAYHVRYGGSRDFARDMTYSIAWGLFALGLLIIGIRCRARPARYAAIALLVATLLKLFLYDLAALKSVYRVGALLGVAVITFAASFLYQQYFNRNKSP